MLEALESAQSKLREYYGRTDENELGDIYAHGTILAPQHKLQFFQTKDWTGDYAASYLESLQHRIGLGKPAGRVQGQDPQPEPARVRVFRDQPSPDPHHA
jgi:hypothetical protein